MTCYLTIYVHAHEGRYHGDGDELPSPFRLFQALVAGAGISGPLDEPTKEALVWLEGLPDAPLVASPRLSRGQAVTMFMPNNDLDKFGGDVRNIAKTRGAQKVWRPRHFDASVPWIYAWPLANADEEQTHASTICALAEKLYQLGRGVDMAWAWGELFDEEALEAQLLEYDGVVHRPSGGNGLLLACPINGSFESLDRRYRASRFRTEGGQRVFVQQPKPSYRQVSYESPPARHIFELRSLTDSERRVAWPLERASSLVVAARVAARALLTAKMPGFDSEIEQYLVGRKPGDTSAVSAESRVRIIPIPSIGMHYADRAIRRLLVEVPAECRLRSDDVRWAFSGAELFDPDTGEVKGILLSPSSGDDMLRHYGIGAGARVFRSVTPVAIPDEGRRRRIEPTRRMKDAKRGLERVVEIAGARAAVVQALRHAGTRAPVESIRLRREPFDAYGARAEGFEIPLGSDKKPRFSKHQLWHVEVGFAVPVTGPLLLGDGRFCGLGLLAPAADVVPDLHAFAIAGGLVGQPEPIEVSRALRRAVMARVQAAIGERASLPAFFSGHAEDGTPVQRARSSHLFFAFAPDSHQLLIIAPHVAERRAPLPEELDHLRTLDAALEGFGTLRAGSAGIFSLARHSSDVLLVGRSHTWRTVTPYVVTRHAKGGLAADALVADVFAECRRLGLSKPRVETSNVHGQSGVGLVGDVKLTFKESVAGPLLLGRNRYLGGGLFHPVADSD